MPLGMFIISYSPLLAASYCSLQLFGVHYDIAIIFILI